MVMGRRSGLCDGQQGEVGRGAPVVPGGLSRVVVLAALEADFNVRGEPSAMIFLREAKTLRRWFVPSELMFMIVGSNTWRSSSSIFLFLFFLLSFLLVLLGDVWLFELYVRASRT